MNKEKLVHELIEAYSEAYVKLGYSSLMGKIVALLIASPNPLSLDDIAEQLQMSKGPISQISRKLKEHQVIQKVWIPGERKDYYQATDDIFGQAFENYAASMKKNADLGTRISALALECDLKDKQVNHIKSRMDEMMLFYNKMDKYNSEFIQEWKKEIKPYLKEVINN